MQDTPQQEFSVGSKFSIEVPVGTEVEKVRAYVKEKTGFDAHLSVQIGPLVREGRGFACDFKAVDEKILEGQFSQFPSQEDTLLFIGRLK